MTAERGNSPIGLESKRCGNSGTLISGELNDMKYLVDYYALDILYLVIDN